MRRFTMVLKTPYQPISNPFVTSLRTSKSRTMAHSEHTWRTADLVCTALGVEGPFSVAHQMQAA
jgi:hypothetical protein